MSVMFTCTHKWSQCHCVLVKKLTFMCKIMCIIILDKRIKNVSTCIAVLCWLDKQMFLSNQSSSSCVPQWSACCSTEPWPCVGGREARDGSSQTVAMQQRFVHDNVLIGVRDHTP